MIAWSETRTLAHAEAELAPDQPVALQRFVSALNHSAIHLFERSGYQHIRTFYRMLINFDGRVEPQPLPDGIELRPFDPDQHAQAVFAAQEEAFADHWGYEPGIYEEWTHYMLDAEAQDFSLWQIAWEGDEIAGVCLNQISDDDRQKGWVGTLGVRRHWRKRGLGLALLEHSFALFQDRGLLRAGLGVDASSLTNAVALYERAGMHASSESWAYRKMLRGDAPAE